MGTRTRRYRTWLGVGIAVLAAVGSALTCTPGAFAAGSIGAPKPQGPIGTPTLELKQNDLAATGLVPGIQNVPSPSGRISRVPILTAYCANLGVKPYAPGARRLRIMRMEGNSEVVVASRLIPALPPGFGYFFTQQIPLGGIYDHWVEVTEGNQPDDDPENDFLDPEWEIVEKH